MKRSPLPLGRREDADYNKMIMILVHTWVMLRIEDLRAVSPYFSLTKYLVENFHN